MPRGRQERASDMAETAPTNPHPFADQIAVATAEHGQTVSLTVAAKLVGISRRTIGRAMESGELPVYRFGKSQAYRVRIDDLFGMLVPTGAAS